jgi:hypothetical protein
MLWNVLVFFKIQSGIPEADGNAPWRPDRHIDRESVDVRFKGRRTAYT